MLSRNVVSILSNRRWNFRAFSEKEKCTRFIKSYFLTFKWHLTSNFLELFKKNFIWTQCFFNSSANSMNTCGIVMSRLVTLFCILPKLLQTEFLLFSLLTFLYPTNFRFFSLNVFCFFCCSYRFLSIDCHVSKLTAIFWSLTNWI